MPIAVSDNQNLPQLQVTPDGLTKFLPQSTNLPLKKRKAAKFSNGFRGVEYRWADRYGCFARRHSGSRFPVVRLMAPDAILSEGPT